MRAPTVLDVECSLSPTLTLPERRKQRATERAPGAFARFRAGLYGSRHTYVSPARTRGRSSWS